jgi:DNA-binding NarL/FixJ family response regulator
MKIKIMIVDDHPFVRIAFKQIFREDSNILFSGESDNGLDFIELVKNSTPDIAIIDLQLPGMSGHDVISQIHNEYPEVKIIAFSAFFDLTNQNKAIKNGAFATISKTEPKKAVREAILGVIEGKSFHSKAVTFFDHGKESNEDNLELLSTREKQILLRG